MTAKYDRDEITFQYPENWSLDEDPPQGVPRTISVTSETGAFWSATVYGGEQSLEELQRQYLDTFQQEYEDLEQEAVEIELVDNSYRAVDLQFYCLDFLVHSRLIAAQLGDYHVLLTWQAEDRDFDKLEDVFLAISFSALRDTVPSASD